MHERLVFAATAAVLVGAVNLPVPVSAAPGLPIGACVLVDKLYRGKIIAVNPDDNGSYTIQDSKGGPDYRMPNRLVVASACAGGQVDAGGEAPAPRDMGQQAQLARGQAPEAAVGGACFASETDRGAGLESTFRGIIRSQFERQAARGSDGTTTLRFLSFRMDGGRQATVIDRVNYKPDMSKPVYSVRALFETCADYRTATTTKTLERNFQCFTSSTGGYNCSASGSMAGMRKDESVYRPK
ncbi:MAG TPA: hypothetical protein VIO94_12410 [Phenylobacterium sp.]